MQHRACRRLCVMGLAVLLMIPIPALAKKKAAEPPLPPPPVPQAALSVDASPAYPPGFDSFEYVSGYAESGGTITVGEVGTFDALSPFIDGAAADRRLYSPSGPFESYVFESLMVRSHDERYGLYGLIAQTVEVTADAAQATFTLDPAATFSDGKPVTAADVIFSAEAMREHGPAGLKADLAWLAALETPSDDKVTFRFNAGAGLGAVLAAAAMPILPKHFYEAHGFEKSVAMKNPVGTGPYTIASYEPGETLVYRLRTNYWAKSHPTRRGHFNFGEVRVLYFPDRESHFAAFQDGKVQIWIEENPVAWEEAFSFFNARSGLIYREEFAYGQRASPGEPRRVDRIARWVDIDRPRRLPAYGAAVDTWWSAYTN